MTGIFLSEIGGNIHFVKKQSMLLPSPVLNEHLHFPTENSNKYISCLMTFISHKNTCISQNLQMDYPILAPAFVSDLCSTEYHSSYSTSVKLKWNIP